MTKFSKKDLIFSVVTGLITGLMAWGILDFLNIAEFNGIPWQALLVVGPVIFILGVLLGYFLGQWLKFFDQFGKFCAIGLTNAAVDFGMLNFLIAQTGYDAGWWFTGFKAISFIIAGSISFLWNKYWAFNAGNTEGGGLEFGKFFAVAIVAAIINNLAASFVVNGVGPLAGLDTHTWANVGAVVGSAVALVFSFVGFKLAVFKK